MKNYGCKKMRFLFFIFFFAVAGSLEARNILLFGDSHQGAFAGITGCHSVLNDGITMHRVGRDRNHVLDLSKVQIGSQDALIFIFGQIDVGWHVCKQRDISGRTLDEIINTLVTNYLTALKEITEPYPRVLKIVYSILPPSNIFIHQTLKIGYSGTLEERSWITRELNGLLKILCPIYGFEFLDVYSDYSTAQGTLRLEFNDGSGYHIDAKYNHPIRTKLAEILNKHPEI